MGSDFEDDKQISVELMSEWIRDLKGCDPIAQWCYEALGNLYDMDTGQPIDTDRNGKE
jgi:hypothetical protein